MFEKMNSGRANVARNECAVSGAGCDPSNEVCYLALAVALVTVAVTVLRWGRLQMLVMSNLGVSAWTWDISRVVDSDLLLTLKKLVPWLTMGALSIVIYRRVS